MTENQGIVGLTPAELQSLIRSVGTHRTDRALSPSEVASLLERAIQAGSSRGSCADQLGISTSQVSAFLKLTQLPEDIGHLASWGSATDGIAFSTMALLSQLRSPSAQREAASAVLEHGLSWKETVQFVQIADRSADSISNVLQSVLALRPEVEVRHLFVGSIGDPGLQSTLQGMSQAERDVLIDRTLGHLRAHSMTGRLGPSSFTLVSLEQSPLFGDPEDLETQVNGHLTRMAGGSKVD